MGGGGTHQGQTAPQWAPQVLTMPSLCKVPAPLLVLVNTTKSWEARSDFWSDCGEGFWGVTTWALWHSLWSFQTGGPIHPLWAYPQLNPGFSSEIKNRSVNISWYRLSAIMGLFVFWHPLRQSLVTNKQATLSAHPTSLPQCPLWRVMLSGDGRWEGLLNHRLLMAPPWPGLPQRLNSKKSACQCRRCKFNPWVGKIPWRRKQQAHSSILAWQSHGQRSLVGCSPWSCKRVGLDWVTKQWKQQLPWPGRAGACSLSRPCSGLVSLPTSLASLSCWLFSYWFLQYLQWLYKARAIDPPHLPCRFSVYAAITGPLPALLCLRLCCGLLPGAGVPWNYFPSASGEDEVLPTASPS